MTVAAGVGGYLVNLRHSRRNDENEKALLVWIVLAWLGLAVLVAT